MTEFNVDRMLRQDLEQFPAYSASSFSIAEMDGLIKLDTNENPFGPCPRVLEALANNRLWGRYASQDELRPALAQYVGVEPENIVVGNGADEVIDLIQRVFLQPGDRILDCPPSFEMYHLLGRLNAARIVEVPRREDFSLDIDAIERAVAETTPKMLFLANPNNPDGTATPRADLERLLRLPTLVVLDEAYAEFYGESLAERVNTQPNLVVIRTFSKWAGLAGLRVGYCIAPKRIASQILRIKSPYNVNMAGIIAARASLQDVAFLQANVQRIIDERERLTAALACLEYLEPLPSKTNFILCRVLGRDALELRDALARRRVLIRAYAMPRLCDYIRISVGTPEQDDVLLRALSEA